MREIKFRAWDNDNAAWNEVKIFVLMQFTGLRDKNNKEIYEGDIIQGKYDKILIKWAKTGFYPYGNKDGAYTKVTNWNSVENGEVIGNVWEHPHLLERSQ